MTELTASLLCLAAIALHLGSIGLALSRVTRPAPRPSRRPPVTVLRPVCGIDNHALTTLRSGFTIDYPDYELIHCVARADDPVIPLIDRLRALHPKVPCRLLIGDVRISSNPKLNNLVHGWAAASHPWIVMTDSNVLCPPDYLDRLLSAWTPGTGLVTSPPVGCMAESLWAELECAWLNTYEARWQLAADAVGLGFAQGKSLFWRKADLERAGGLAALAREPAEDAASTRVVREAGLRVRLVGRPFGQPLGHRGLAAVWQRQVRWSRLRRMTFTRFFLPEILTGILPALLATMLAGWTAPAIAALVLGWYAAEAILARAAGWDLSWRSPFLWLLRDLLLPAQWCLAWSGGELTWRGHAVVSAEAPAPARQSV